MVKTFCCESHDEGREYMTPAININFLSFTNVAQDSVRFGRVNRAGTLSA